MTVFSLRCFRNPSARHLVRRLAAAALLVFSLGAGAEGIAIKSAELTGGEDGYLLSAEAELTFPQAVEDALNKGLPLNFVAEFELKRPRWYWFDETVTTGQQHLRLAYHALTRQYQLTQNGQLRTFASLGEAKSALGQVRDWPVLERGTVKKNTAYVAGFRLWLDVSQLPKPLQLNALASKDWSLDSGWHHWALTP
jgi:hypothetical protein